MTNATLKINGIDFANLSAKKKAELAAIFGVSVDDLSITVPKKKEINNLQMKDGSENIAIDKFSSEEFDINFLTEKELNNAKRTGLSPTTYAKYQEGEAIRKMMGKVRPPKAAGVISAAKQVHQILESYIDTINELMISKLTDKAFSKQMSLTYPLFIEIPANATDEQKKEMRMDGKHPRFSPRVWTFPQLEGLHDKQHLQ